MTDQLIPQLLMNYPVLHIHIVEILNKCMEEFSAKNILLQNDSYEMLNISSDISFDIFKELSGVIFSVHLILPYVADCYLKDHLHVFY